MTRDSSTGCRPRLSKVRIIDRAGGERHVVFHLADVRYELMAAPGSEIVFFRHAPGLVPRLDRDDPRRLWPEDVEDEAKAIHDGNFGGSAVPVLVAVRHLVVAWVKDRRPYDFQFTASTPRKVPVYAWAAARLSRELEQTYLHQEMNGIHWFFRRLP